MPIGLTLVSPTSPPLQRRLEKCYYDVMFSRGVAVYANYIGPSVMTDANCEGFPICDDRITENDRCVVKIVGIHWNWANTLQNLQFFHHFTMKFDIFSLNSTWDSDFLNLFLSTQNKLSTSSF